jgi:uncharacterized SAM-binding protein YcdF (DUF218 family)
MNEYLSFTYLLGAVLAPPVSLILLGLFGLLLARRRRRLGLSLTGASLLGLLALSLPVVAFSLMSRLEGPPLPNSRAAGDAQAIVILAGGVARGAVDWGGDTISLFTLQRVRYGAWLAKETRLPVLITGAAPRADGRPGEAAMMRAVLQDEFGVPVRWVDDRARTTAGNAREAAALLRAAGIQRVALVTSAFHMPRSQRVFERAGLKVIPARTGYFGYAGGRFEWTHLVPSGDSLRLSYLALREMAANLMYLVIDRE